MGDLAARKGSEDTIDQRARRLRTELDRDAVTATLAFIGEIDSEHVIEGRVIRKIEIDVGGVDLHPAFTAFGAADQRGFFDDIGAHMSLLGFLACAYSAAMLLAEAARWRLKKLNTLLQPSRACSGR